MYSRGINRNIVECKDLSNVIVSIKSLVLIETSWNVKQIRQLEKTKLELCINRNIVECKAKLVVLYNHQRKY